MIILRNTIINNSQRGLRFLFWCVHQLLFARLIAIHSSWTVDSMSPPTCICCDCCCYIRVPFHQLASLPGFHFAPIPKGNIVYTYQSDISQVRNRLVKQVVYTPWPSQVEGSIPGVLSYFLCAILFHLFVWRRVASQPRIPVEHDTLFYTININIRRICLACNYDYRVLLLLCVLLYCCCCCCSCCSSSCSGW